jgi:protein-disulfide isomerase
MVEARNSRAPRGARVLALCLALGSIGCERSSRAGAYPGYVDSSSAEARLWDRAVEPELTDDDVDEIALRVPRAKVPAVSAHHPSKGDPNAQVTLQVFSDFECSFCARAATTLSDIEASYRGKVRLVFRNYPLRSHQLARPAARSALAVYAAAGSAKFWQLHDALYAPDADLSDRGLRDAVASLSLAPERLKLASSDAQLDALIDADVAAGDAAGVQGTPAVFMNDYYLIGARSFGEYAIVAERALRDAASGEASQN